ncbi:Teichoic acid translocation permease protein TagG [Anaerolineae bacterium]|nr:Teichoic acid translocation permease protein TagG [Anaerolineae bacterium]
MKWLTELYHYRDLLVLWIGREVRIRYKQSVLGVGWAILQPLALTLVFTVVFSRIVQVETKGIPYPIFAYAALVPWTFFATSLSFGIPSLVNNLNLVGKIYFPREILPLASIGAAVLDFAMAIVVFAGLMLVYQIPLTINVLWFIPLIIIQIMLTIGVTLLGAAIIVFFRDVRFVIPLLVQIWMYASPVIYPTDLVPPQYRAVYFLNPMAGLIDGYRRVLVTGQAPQADAVGLSAIIALTLLLLGYFVFKRTEPVFADLI